MDSLDNSAPVSVDANVAGDPAGDAAVSDQTALDGATQDAGTDPATATTDEGQAQETASDAAPTGEAAELAKLIEQFAKETGLDPNDPAQRKTLTRLAEKERYINQLKSKTSELEAKLKPTEAPVESDGLTEFERTLAGQQAEAEDEASGKPEAEPNRQGAVGANWKTPNDAFADYSTAWSEVAEAVAAGKPADYSKVHQIQEAIFDAQLSARKSAIESLVNQRVEQIFQEQLGEALPKIKDSVWQDKLAESREFALSQLETQFPDIRELYKPIDGSMLTIKGDKVPNTPLNQVLAKVPEILNITVERGPKGQFLSESDAYRMTMIARLRAAKNYLASSKVPSGVTQKIVTAAEANVKREQVDRARQALNSGQGATSSNADGKEHSLNRILPGENRDLGSYIR